MARRVTVRALRIRRKGRDVQVSAGPKLFSVAFGRRRGRPELPTSATPRAEPLGEGGAEVPTP